MKRGKDEEKTMGPMFPRLHVNDTEKGGPRAPPRNKMALYEQLSIPSQRFNGGMLPLNPNSTASSVPPSSSTQEPMKERSSFFPLQQPPAVHSSERTNNRYPDLNNQLVQQEPQKKQEEDDFRVPIFVQQSGLSPNRSTNHQNRDNEGPSLFSSGFSGRLAKVQNACEQRNHQEVAKSSSNQPPRQSAKVPSKQSEGSSSFGHRNSALNHSSRLQGNESVPDCRVDPQADNTIWGDSVSNEAIRAVGHANSSLHVRDAQEMIRSPNDPTNGDAVSETSMIDSISGADISPDDVVGIIGQKHFWKARRAIVNQQRVFAVQVFELHRLIKVQKLIAGSPHVMVEDDAYLGKTITVSPTKKIPLEYVVKSTQNVPKHKDGCEKPSEELEFSAENAVEKASLSSVQNGSQAKHHKTFSGNPLPPSDPKMGSWSFNQPAGHQWLIPVMSPSEGLIYKPYPGPGFMSPVCGGYGPPGSTPMIGHNFVNYGAPPPHHHHYQGPTGVHPFGPPASHGYFPPYGMPMMNPSISSSGAEQMNPFNVQHQGSCNVPSDKNTGEVPSVGKFHGPKRSEAQLSTASSPSERTQGRNALPLFPTSPPDEATPQPPHEAEPTRVIRVVPHNAREAEPTRVIRVVPHNARSATESVARIFQSIQEERKQFDSI